MSQKYFSAKLPPQSWFHVWTFAGSKLLVRSATGDGDWWSGMKWDISGWCDMWFSQCFLFKSLWLMWKVFQCFMLIFFKFSWLIISTRRTLHGLPWTSSGYGPGDKRQKSPLDSFESPQSLKFYSRMMICIADVAHVLEHLPSGKRLQNHGKIGHVQWVNPQSPCSIAMWTFTRG